MFSFIKKIDTGIDKLAAWLLVFAVMSMLLLSSLSIVARWFQYNITWIDPFVRHLVFVSAFLGGVGATGKGAHIGIDIVGKIVESKGYSHLKETINKVVLFSSICVLSWLIKAGITFTQIEMEYSKTEFWGIESGYLVMLLPVGLIFLLLRFITVLILSFSSEKINEETA